MTSLRKGLLHFATHSNGSPLCWSRELRARRSLIKSPSSVLTCIFPSASTVIHCFGGIGSVGGTIFSAFFRFLFLSLCCGRTSNGDLSPKYTCCACLEAWRRARRCHVRLGPCSVWMLRPLLPKVWRRRIHFCSTGRAIRRNSSM